MTDDDIKAARALCEAATPGAWAFMDEAYPWVAGAVDEDIAGPSTVVEFNECGEQAQDDAAFIAAARTLVPDLLDELEIARDDAAIARRDADAARKDLADLRGHLHRSGIFCDDPDCGDRDCPGLDALEAARRERDAARAKAANYERDWYAAKSEFGTARAKLTADLAATKASLAEAVNLLEQAHDYRDDSKIFAACVAALKAKVRP